MGPDIVLRALYALSLLILPTAICGKHCYCPHFADEESEAQRDELTSQGPTVVELGFESKLFGSRASSFNHGAILN